MEHWQIWRALDRLAEARGLSVSGLAQEAGLDPTSFNKSKRFMANGRPRWPGTESLCKAMKAVGCSSAELFNLMQASPQLPANNEIPCLALADIGWAVFDRDGFPQGEGWMDRPFPEVSDSHLFGLEVTDDRYEPVFRTGGLIVAAPRVSVRKGDRVVARLKGEGIGLYELTRITAHRLVFRELTRQENVVERIATDVMWQSRIVWSSQ